MDKGHTKTPWGMRAAWGDDEEAEIYPAWDRPEVGDSAEICLVKEWGVHTAEDNAAFIVRAVNQHEPLLKCAEALREARGMLRSCDFTGEYDEVDPDLKASWDRGLAKIEAVNTPKDINHV